MASRGENACTDQLVSLVQAVRDKYEDMQDESLGVLLSRSPSSGKGGLMLPPILCMDLRHIDRAGEETALKQLLKFVEELDLMKNEIHSWRELYTILECSPMLRSLNLSQNPLHTEELGPKWSKVDVWKNLSSLALNQTKITWPQLLRLLPHFTGLTELHLAMNGLSEVPESAAMFLSVHRLIYNSNGCSSFSQVVNLSKIFPGLEHLLLIGNGIAEIGGELSKALKQNRNTFKFLCYLNLSENQLKKWSCIDELHRLPTLIDLRLSGNPILEKLTTTESRMQVISRLPELVRLNGSPVGEQEREDAERAFIRLYMSHNSKPPRYFDLVKKHGKLNPLANVDLKPRSVINFVIRWAEVSETKMLNIDQNVGDFKKDVCDIFGQKPAQTRLFYLDKEVNVEDELKYLRRKMHSYRPKDGDELILCPK